MIQRQEFIHTFCILVSIVSNFYLLSSKVFLISINRYYDAIKNLGIQLFGNNHPRLKELQFYLGCIIEHKYLQDQDLKEAGFAASEGLIYYN